MATVSKSVWIVKNNTAGGGKVYTNVMLSDEKWYGLGKEVDTKDGDGIKFNFTKNDKGYLNADPDSIEVFAGKGKTMPDDKKTSKKASGKSGKGGWTPKAQPAHVQISIMAQSAQKAATDIVVAAIGADKLKIPAAKKDQFDAIMGYVDVITDMMLAKTAGIMVKVENGLAISDLINTLPIETSDSFDKDTGKVEKKAKAEPTFDDDDDSSDDDGDDFVETDDTETFD